MNLPLPKRINIPIVFDSENYDDYSYYESYSESYSSEIIIPAALKPGLTKTIKYQPKFSANNNNTSIISKSQSHIFRHPIPKNESKSSFNSQKDKLQSTPQIIHQNLHHDDVNENEINIEPRCPEIKRPKLVNFRTYLLIKKKNSTIFTKTKSFLFYDKGQIIHQITLKNQSKPKIKLTSDTIMYFRRNFSQFVIKTYEDEPKSLASVTFSAQSPFNKCSRSAIIRFSSDGSLPSKVVSLPFVDDSIFNGRFYIESKKNVAFALVNTSEPVLSARKIKSGMLQIDTVLDLKESVLFGVAVALYVGKNGVSCNEMIIKDRQKFQLMRFPPFF